MSSECQLSFSLIEFCSHIKSRQWQVIKFKPSNHSNRPSDLFEQWSSWKRVPIGTDRLHQGSRQCPLIFAPSTHLWMKVFKVWLSTNQEGYVRRPVSANIFSHDLLFVSFSPGGQSDPDQKSHVFQSKLSQTFWKFAESRQTSKGAPKKSFYKSGLFFSVIVTRGDVFIYLSLLKYLQVISKGSQKGRPTQCVRRNGRSDRGLFLNHAAEWRNVVRK